MKAIVEDKDREITSLKHQLNLITTELTKIRENQTNAVSMADVQQLLANQGGQGKRGVFAPGQQLNPTFDAQTAQITANHITGDLAKAAKKPVKRQRARIG